MNRISLFLVLILLLNVNCVFSQISNAADLSKAIEQKETLHSFNIWQLERIRGNDKAIVTLNAIEYYVLNTTIKTYAVQFDVNLESGSVNDPANRFVKRHYLYIQEGEYAKVMVALKEIVKDYRTKKDGEQFGSAQYVTIDGIKIGYEYTLYKDLAYIEYNLNGGTFRAEFQYPGKLLELLHDQLDIASQKLYLPEYEEKLKKAKKSKQEAKDVIIDDI